MAPAVFISHRHKDADVAAALIRLLEAEFNITKRDIRCTSVSPYGFAVGEPITNRLREEIGGARAVLGIFSPDTRESSFVLFELGACWGQKIRPWPLLAKGGTAGHLPAPLQDLHCLLLTERKDCRQLLDDLSATGLPRRPPRGPRTQEKKEKEKKIDKLVQLAAGVRTRRQRTDTLGIEIIEPAPGDAITGDGRDFLVKGRFKSRPHGRLQLFITNVAGNKIWPQGSRVAFNAHTNEWEARATLLDQPPKQAHIKIAEIDEAGQLLYDYYTEVGNKTGEWIPLKHFTPGTRELHTVHVWNKTDADGR